MSKDPTKKKGKGKWIALAVVLVLACLIGGCIYKVKTSLSSLTEAISTQTANAEVITLTKSVGAAGTIKSNNKKDISVDLTGIKLSEMDVAVGDTVTAGQILAKFDTSDIEDNLDDAKDSLEIAKAQNELSEESAERTLSDTQRNASYTVDSAKTNVDDARESYDDAVEDLEDTQDEYDKYYKLYTEAESKITSLTSDIKKQTKTVASKNTALTNAASDLASKKTAYETAKASRPDVTDGESRDWNHSGEEAIKEAYDAYVAAQKTYDTALSEYNTASKKLTSLQTSLTTQKANSATYKAEYEELSKLVKSGQKTVDAAKKQYDATVKSYNNTVASEASQVASASDNVTSTKLAQQNSTDSYEKQITNYEEQLENGILTSPISGVVTAVNLEEGDTYQAGTVLTIQDTTDFYIEAEISEYDIADVAVGEKVLIKTDATGDTQMSGTVIFVSPVASNSALATGSSATYTIKISIDDPSDRLRLDMSASLSIIIEQHDNALVVPYNTISQDEEGNYFVLRQNEDGSFETIYVTVVMESNYYTEISSDQIKDGDTLQIVDTSDTTDLWSIMMDEEDAGF